MNPEESEAAELDVSSCIFEVTNSETGELILRTTDVKRAFDVKGLSGPLAIVTVKATVDIGIESFEIMKGAGVEMGDLT